MKNFFSLLLGTIIITYLLISCQSPAKETVSQKPITTQPKKKIKDTIEIVAVGDMMLGSAFPSKVNLPPDDAVQSFAAVQPFLQGDIVFGNLEGCFLNAGNSNKCKGLNPNNCYAFRMPDRYGDIFKKAGFNLLSVANNHVAILMQKAAETQLKF